AAGVLAASAANAASNIDDNVSSGSSALAWSTRQSIVGPASGKLGDSTLSVQVSADLDPVADTTKPLLAVDMPKGVVVQAQWVDDKTITLSVVDDGTKDATLKAEHTLAPHVTVFIDAFGFSLTYDYSAAALLPAIPGAKWSYDAVGSSNFAPWGWDKAETQVIAPALADAQLFSIAFPTIAGQPILGGQLALNATTTPTFAYTTKSVALMSMNAITTKAGSIQIPTVDTDFLDVPAMVKGEISWQGSLLVRPSVTITSIGSFTLPVSLTLDLPIAGVDLPYSSGTAPIAVSFPSTRFHIPLPNVKVLDQKLDLGDVTVGQTTTKQAKIGNTGEMEGAMTFKSSDPQFVVVGTKVSVASKGDYALDVKFTPGKVGAQAADITVASNDPNEPAQTIHVTGNGVQVPTPPAPPAEEPTTDDQPIPRGDNGCGCRAAPTSGEIAPYALFGLVALVARRRRR
ncbi:MAG TPA: choice-of-anchor D domain-containing protein, partial [Labilithrix sp.]